jgi:lipopolysaccharide transport system permease protein
VKPVLEHAATDEHAGEATPAPAASTTPAAPVVIRPASPWSLGLREVWEYRELVYFMSWRDVKVRYRQTLFGAAWAILQPFLLMIVFTVFLGHLAGVSSQGVPYPIFSYTALVPWTLFSAALIGAAGSVVSSAPLVSKIYFPRLVLPIASVGSNLVDFVIAFGLIVAMMVYYGIYPGWHVVMLPAFVVLAVAAALAVGIGLSAVCVRYRDVRYAVPFLVQIWLFASPIAYSASVVPAAWRNVYALNPMVGVIEGFRWALLGIGPAPGHMVAVSALATLVLLAAGALYFKRIEGSFADVI